MLIMWLHKKVRNYGINGYGRHECRNIAILVSKSEMRRLPGPIWKCGVPNVSRS